MTPIPRTRGPEARRCIPALVVLPAAGTTLAAGGDQILHPGSWPPAVTIALVAAIVAVIVALALVALREHRRANAGRTVCDNRNRVLRTVHAIHQLIEREPDPDRLLESACSVLVEHGEFVMAWIGAPSADGRVVPRAAAGHDAHYLETVEIRYDDSPLGHGPTGTALREGRTIIARDWQADGRMVPWLDQGADRGYRSSLATPIRGGRDNGLVLSVYCSRADAFNAETLALLEELAGDLGRALRALDREAIRAKAAAALHESHRVLLESQRVAHIGSYRLDVRTGRWDSSAVLDEIFGITDPGFEKNIDSWLAIVHPDDRGAMETYLRDEVLGLGRPFDREYRIKTLSDGTVRWVYGRGALVPGSDGRAVEMFGTIQDVTEHRRADERLHDSIASLEDANEKLRLLVEGSPHYFFYLQDVAGNITYVSPSVASITGRPPEVWLGQNHWWTTDSPINDVARVATSRHLAGEFDGEPVAVEVRHADGQPILLEVFESGRYRDGRLVGLQGVAHDITERRHLEDQLRQAQKMEAVGRLAGGVAHDFNNLLQALLSQTQLLQDPHLDPGRVAAVAAEIEQQVRRGASLTRQLLLFSRRETSQRQQLDLNELVEGHATMLRPLVRENIAVRLNLEPQLLPVMADPGQLEQVLMNLVVNASDALLEGGELTIRTGHDDADTVWLSVEDTGPGIPHEIRGAVFEPFFTTKPAGQGTGLGLSVVLGIVTQHRGHVELTERDGGGTVVRVSLPRSPTPAPADTAPAPFPDTTLPRGSRERILLVEDEPMTRAGLTDVLDMLGYEVVAAASAEEAEALPPDAPFHILLTDFVLPGKTGTQLAEALLTRWPELRIILMSGYAADETVRRSVAAGSVRFLQKPFDMLDLAAELKQCLGAGVPPPRRR